MGLPCASAPEKRGGMLQYLRIANLALLDAVELEFDAGFIALTGETGAGKSVLLGALSLLSGARAEKTIIRRGADACEVEAVIHFSDTSDINQRLASLDLPPCEEGSLLLSRTIPREKAARVQINGVLTTLRALQEIGEGWIDFHGPGEPQKLFSEAWQLTLLDAYTEHGEAMDAYRSGYRSWRKLLAEIEALRTAEQLSDDERAFLQAQIEMIDAAEVSTEGMAQLERDFARLSGAQELTQQAGHLVEGLNGDDGVGPQLGQLLLTARQLARIDASLEGLADRIESLIVETADIAGDYERLLGEVEFDEEAAAAIEARMQSWMNLKRRFGGDVALVLDKRAQLAERLERQGDVEGRMRKLEKEAGVLEKQLTGRAEKIREARVHAASRLAKEAAAVLVHLGFRKARLTIEILREEGLREHGHSRCSFRFAPNAGEDLLPLNKIASSGELARVMLALKAVLAGSDATPVLVFDEVDANVGGEIAGAVAAQLAELGKAHQVFCVTHLPQVAGVAASHFVVRKSQTDKATFVEIGAVHSDREARLDELARMLGDRSSANARRHAEELLRGKD